MPHKIGQNRDLSVGQDLLHVEGHPQKPGHVVSRGRSVDAHSAPVGIANGLNLGHTPLDAEGIKVTKHLGD